MKYRIIATSRFEKDVKRCKKRNLPMEKLKKVIRLLEETGNYLLNISRINYLGNMREVGNVILCQIGC